MLWMERVTIIVYVITAGFLFLANSFISSQGPLYHSSSSDWNRCFTLPFYFALVCWVVFRGIDFLFAGPLRRQVKHEQFTARHRK